MLTKQSPEYVALVGELDKLSDSVEAINSLVFDQAGLIWCTGVAIYSNERPILYGQIAEVLEKQDPPLTRADASTDWCKGKAIPSTAGHS